DRAEAHLAKRLPLRVLPRGGHRLIDALGEDGAIAGAAVVVLARGDVAAASRGVHLRDPRLVRLPALAGQADEIRGDAAAAVVTHRVRRVTTEGQERFLAVPEAQRLEPGVDGAFG